MLQIFLSKLSKQKEYMPKQDINTHKGIKFLTNLFWRFERKNNIVIGWGFKINLRDLKNLDVDAQKGQGLLALDVVFKFSTNFWVFQFLDG